MFIIYARVLPACKSREMPYSAACSATSQLQTSCSFQCLMSTEICNQVPVMVAQSSNTWIKTSKAKSCLSCNFFSYSCSQQSLGELWQGFYSFILVQYVLLYIKIYIQCQKGHPLRSKHISFIFPLLSIPTYSCHFYLLPLHEKGMKLPSFYRSGISNPVGQHTDALFGLANGFVLLLT